LKIVGCSPTLIRAPDSCRSSSNRVLDSSLVLINSALQFQLFVVEHRI
jgi:hypothetical protein